MIDAESFLYEILKTLVFDIGKRIENLDTSSDGLFAKARNALQKARDGIALISTGYKKDKVLSKSDKEKWEEETVLFWLLMPSKYVVLYNLGKKYLSDKEEFSQEQEEKGGSFCVTGQALRGDIAKQGFESKGWLHMSDSEYREIENEYNKYKQYWTEIKIEQSIIEERLTGKAPVSI